MTSVWRPMRSFIRTTTLALTLAVVSACGNAGSPSPTPGPSIIPGPTGGGALTTGDLRLRLIAELGPRWYCDPDSYPIGRDEQQSAIERYPQIRTEDPELFEAVARDLGIDPAAAHTDAEKLALWRGWKLAASIQLDPIGGDRYRFDYLAQPVDGAAEGLRTGGIIDATGTIEIEQQAAAGEPMCPICLARGTMIDTPDGPIAVELLRIGDPIWTMDANGRRVPGTVIALGSVTAPLEHRVIRLTLADGRSVTASPGHPLADGRALGELAIGDLVDGSPITNLASVPYTGGQTFDLVASGPTGSYFSDGIPLGTTLRPAADRP